MNRNPIIPFVLIMVIGVGAMFLMSFKGLGDMEEIAAEKEGGGEQSEEAASPEELFTQKGCVGCHGNDYNGTGNNPSLLGVGDRLTQEEIEDILVNGKGAMPPGLLTPDQAPAMAEWLATLK